MHRSHLLCKILVSTIWEVSSVVSYTLSFQSFWLQDLVSHSVSLSGARVLDVLGNPTELGLHIVSLLTSGAWERTDSLHVLSEITLSQRFITQSFILNILLILREHHTVLIISDPIPPFDHSQILPHSYPPNFKFSLSLFLNNLSPLICVRVWGIHWNVVYQEQHP